MKLGDLPLGMRFMTPYNKRRGVVIYHAPNECGTLIRWEGDTKNMQISVATEVKPLND